MSTVENGLRSGWKSRQWAYAGSSGIYRKILGLNVAIKVYKGRECYGLIFFLFCVCFLRDYSGIL